MNEIQNKQPPACDPPCTCQLHHEPLAPDDSLGPDDSQRSSSIRSGLAIPSRCARQILCVWLPNWPIQRVQAVEPSLAGQPLVLTARDHRRGLVVAAANLPARTAGVRPGMRLAEATGLTNLEIRQQDADEDLEALQSLAEQAQRFSPLVGLEQLDTRIWSGRRLRQPECLLLDITGIAGLFGGQANLLSQVGGWLHQQNYFGCLAVGRSIGAAWALANYALRAPAEQQTKSVPKARCILLEPAQETELLAQLPLASLRIDDSTVHTLRRLGLSRVGQLASLPRAGLVNRLGEQLLLRWDQAYGRRDEPILSLHHAPEWSIDQELELPTDQVETIAELVRRAIHSLAGRLEKRGEGALRIVCRMDLVQHAPLLLQLSLFRPTCDRQHLTRLLASQLEQQLPHHMQAPLWRLSVAATLTAPLVWRQSDLFHSDQAANRNEMAHLVDTLSARLGRKQVLGARVQRQSQPELAYVLGPLTGLKPNGLQQDTVRKLSSRQAVRVAEPTREDPLRRPTLLLPSPTTIEVAGLAAAPARVKTANGWHQVMDACGPERLESGWWKGVSCRRDYYRIITHLGCWWWIYRDLNTGQWYLHGIFD